MVIRALNWKLVTSRSPKCSQIACGLPRRIPVCLWSGNVSTNDFGSQRERNCFGNLSISYNLLDSNFSRINNWVLKMNNLQQLWGKRTLDILLVSRALKRPCPTSQLWRPKTKRVRVGSNFFKVNSAEQVKFSCTGSPLLLFYILNKFLKVYWISKEQVSKCYELHRFITHLPVLSGVSFR